MKTICFHSQLASSLDKFVLLHQASGTDYQSSALLLMRFDNFLTQQKIEPDVITQRLFQDYLATCSQMKPRYKANCLGVVSQFCRYLALTKPDCYIPLTIATKSSEDAYNPFIITRQALSDLLALARQLPPSGSLRPLMFTTLIGLLYCTGIRVGEALALNIDDLDLNHQRLLIRQGKYHKARWIYLSASAIKQLNDYLQQRQRIILDKTEVDKIEAPLFISSRKRRLAHPTLTHTFRKLCQQCGIIQNNRTPRLLDLRHTFATHRLLHWYREGIDVQSKLPALATHMGHVDIFSTQVYLHAIPELNDLVSEKFKTHCQTILNRGTQS